MVKNIYKHGFKLFDTCWDIYPKILRKVKFRTGEIILDAGCGSGNLGKYLKRKNLYGVDLAKENIRIPDKNYKDKISANLDDLPYPQDFFNTSISIQVIQYVESPVKVLEELLRVSNERMIITSANFDWFKIKSLIYPKYKKRYKSLITSERYISKKTFKDFAKKNDLKLKIYYVSNKFGMFRNLFGKYLASEVIGVFKLK